MMYGWFKKQSIEIKLFSLHNELSKSPVSGSWKVCNLNQLFKALPSKHSAWQVACNSQGLVSVSDARVIRREVVCGSHRSFLELHFHTVALENVSNEQTRLALPYKAQVICL